MPLQLSEQRDSFPIHFLLVKSTDRWIRFNQLMDAASMGKTETDETPDQTQHPSDEDQKDGSFGFDEVGRILGSPEGSTLRRVVSDANTFALVRHLNSSSARPLREIGQQFVEQTLRSWASRNILTADPSSNLEVKGPSCPTSKEFSETVKAQDKRTCSWRTIKTLLLPKLNIC